MRTPIQFGSLLLLVGAVGCSVTANSTEDSVDSEAAAVLTIHWDALRQGNWRVAFEQIHPDVRANGLTLKGFTKIHTKRRTAKGPRPELKIVGCDRTGDDMTVSFDVLSVPADGGEPVATSPRRTVLLRKVGDSWRLVTSDILAIVR